MSECKRINDALDELGDKLDRAGRSGGNGSGSNGNSGNGDLEKRVKRLEEQMVAVERYINLLDEAGKNITNAVGTLAKIFIFFRI